MGAPIPRILMAMATLAATVTVTTVMHRVNPGADEICDGIDNDSDGAIDDAGPAIVGGSTFYLDDDSDGYGDVSSTTTACVKPSGYVANSDDCNDANASVNPTLLWYLDSDNDGYGTTSTTTSCLKPMAILTLLETAMMVIQPCSQARQSAAMANTITVVPMVTAQAQHRLMKLITMVMDTSNVRWMLVVGMAVSRN